MDIDTTGHVFVATDGGLNGTVEEVSPDGTLAETGLLNGTIDNPVSLVIDQNDNLIIGSSASSNPSVISYTPPTAFQAGKVNFKATNVQYPVSLAVDRSNDIIVADRNGHITLSLSSATGSVLKLVGNSTSTYAVGVDNSGTILISTDAGLGVYDTDLQSGGFNTACNCGGSTAIGPSGAYFVANGQIEYEAAPYTGAAVLNTGLTGESIGNGTSIAVDGLGSVWVSFVYNYSGLVYVLPPFSDYSDNLTYYEATQSSFSPSAVAIDGSGNVWMADYGGGGLVELVGLAAPVVTPKSIAAYKQAEGTRP